MKRRDFLGAVALAAGTSATSPGAASPPDDIIRGEMKYRPLGRTGVEVSLVGLGGYHIGKQKEEAESVRIVRSAIDAGVNFMDNSWDYHEGLSEVRMGNALQGGYRDKVFLMTKVDGRTKKLAASQIDESLKRLKTDHLDLVQHHEVIRLDDPDRILGEGGAHEAFVEAQKAGKVRFLGFTGHKDPLVHLRMLEVADAHGVRFDAAQMPLNVMDAHFRSFAKLVVPELVKRGMGVLGMKSMGDTFILKSKTATPVECLHYAMGLPTSTVIAGIDSMEILKQALDAVKSFRPATPQQTAALLARTADAAASGKFEPFKTSSGFDSTAEHPEWLGKGIGPTPS